MASKPRLAHVVLQTSRLEELRDWYCTVLQAHVVYEGRSLCFITCDEEHHRIALMGVPDLQPRNPGATGMHHTAYTFATLDDLLARYSDLERQGIAPRVPIQHGVTTSLYYQDPDGNFLELQVDNFETPDEATAYMHGPEYASNPIGVAFDPTIMLQARSSGTPVSELTTQGWARAACPGLPDPLAALTSA
jgi:catechol-2,3-dioxygenase